MRKFFLSLLDTEDPKCAKTFIGLFGSINLILAMFIYHTDALVYSVAALSASALAIKGFENINNKTNQ